MVGDARVRGNIERRERCGRRVRGEDDTEKIKKGGRKPPFFVADLKIGKSKLVRSRTGSKGTDCRPHGDIGLREL